VNVLLTLAYDGAAYCGWQRQENGVSVQQRVEESLGSLYGRNVSATGASRTDAGVHARGQRAAFKLDERDVSVPLDKLPYALNARLPEDIVVLKAEEVAENFHPIFSAKAKAYEYRLYNAPFMDPLLRSRCAHVRPPLDLQAMERSAAQLVGTHDFKAFSASGSGAKTSVRTVYSIDIISAGPEITIRIRGNGFLYNMVRIIAGTLVYAGEGKPMDIPAIIASRDREQAGKTMPPYGLCLVEVFY